MGPDGTDLHPQKVRVYKAFASGRVRLRSTAISDFASPMCPQTGQTSLPKEALLRQILTDVACKTKPPRTGRLEIADLRQPGLVLRITSNGARSFAYRFRHPHTRKTLRATIGPYPAITLESARRRAKEMAVQVADGTNPIEARNVEREAAPARTFEALAARYLREIGRASCRE